MPIIEATFAVNNKFTHHNIIIIPQTQSGCIPWLYVIILYYYRLISRPLSSTARRRKQINYNNKTRGRFVRVLLLSLNNFTKNVGIFL